MTRYELVNLIYERTRYFVDVPVADCIFDLIAAEREKVAEESADLLQALQNLHQRCHWADAPEEMDAAKAAIEKAIRARGEA